MQHRMGQVRQAETMIVRKISINSQNSKPGPPKFHVLRRTQSQPMQHTFVLMICSTDIIELRTDVLGSQPFAAPLFMTCF